MTTATPFQRQARWPRHEFATLGDLDDFCELFQRMLIDTIEDPDTPQGVKDEFNDRKLEIDYALQELFDAVEPLKERWAEIDQWEM